MVVVRPYVESDRAAWNGFVDRARTRLFFLRRDYLEYHSDRFADSSLIIEDNGRLLAVLPATVQGDMVFSHGGLTYGGLIMGPRLRASHTFEIFEEILSFYRAQSINRMIYKPAPYIFHQEPSQEDLYAVHRLGGRLYRRDLSSVIHLNARGRTSKGRKSMVSRARKRGLIVEESSDVYEFHRLLSRVLSKHGVEPVHTTAELEYLLERCPHNIVLKVVRTDFTLLAATLLFVFDSVVHTQYIATSEDGKAVGALDLLLEHCIQESADSRFRYFSFGISTEDAGLRLNEGLVAQKEGFGARGIVIDQYELEL